MGLFKPAWMSNSSNTRLNAIRKLSDQSILFELAKSDSNQDVRIAAIAKIDNQSKLKELARGHSALQGEDKVRLAAYQRITEEEQLAEIARDVEFEENLRKDSLARVLDKKLLAMIAESKNKERDWGGFSLTSGIEWDRKDRQLDISIRKDALKRLENRELVLEVSLSAGMSEIKEIAKNMIAQWKMTPKQLKEKIEKSTDISEIGKICKATPSLVNIANDIYIVLKSDLRIFHAAWATQQRSVNDGMIWLKSATYLIEVAKEDPRKLYPVWSKLERAINSAVIVEETESKTGIEMIDNHDYGEARSSDSYDVIKKEKSTGLYFPPYPFED